MILARDLAGTIAYDQIKIDRSLQAMLIVESVMTERIGKRPGR